jgi:methyl-accepting chemotaxis protein
MTWFKNLRLASQLLLAFVVVGLISVATGVSGLTGTSRVSAMMESTYNNNVVSIKYMAEANVALAALQQRLTYYVLNTDPKGPRQGGGKPPGRGKGPG